MGGGNQNHIPSTRVKTSTLRQPPRSIFDPSLFSQITPGEVAPIKESSESKEVLPIKKSIESESNDNTITPPTQGVSTMLKNTAIEDVTDVKEKVTSTASSSSSSSSSSSPAAEQSQTKQKSLSDQLKDAENDLCSYIYLDKGLTTTQQKSFATRTSSFLTSYIPVGAASATYDMLDPVAINNLRLYQDYVKAVKEAKAADSGSRTLLLKNLKNIYKNTSTGGARFPAKMLTLVNLYEAAFKAEAKDAEAFVKSAQGLHSPTGIPGEKANDDAVAEFVKHGQTTPLTHALKDKISKIDEDYKDGKPNRMDSMLISNLVMLHEDMPEDDLVKSIPGYVKRPGEKKLLAIEIMHDLHESLSMLELMRYQVGASKTKDRDASMDAFMQTVTEAKDQLQHHRKPKNAEALPKILETTSKLCDQIEKFIAEKVAGTHPFDAKLAVAYLEKVKTFTQSAQIKSKLEGSAEGLVSAQSNEKKMRNQ